MDPLLVLNILVYLAAGSLAFPGYFEDDDEEERQYSHHYADQYHKYTTPRLTVTTETTEPTVNTALTLRQLFTHHVDHELFRRRRHNQPDEPNRVMDHEQIKQLLGGEFLHPITWTATETQLLDTESDPRTEAGPPPQNLKNYLTLVTASRTPEASFPARIHPNELDREEPSTGRIPLKQHGLSIPNYPFQATRVVLDHKLERINVAEVEPIAPTTAGFLLTTQSIRVTHVEEPTLDLASKEDAVEPSTKKLSDDRTTENLYEKWINRQKLHSDEERASHDIQDSVKTSSFDYFTTTAPTLGKEAFRSWRIGSHRIASAPVTTSHDLPVPVSDKTSVAAESSLTTTTGSPTSIGIFRSMDLSTLPQSHPLQIMVNGTMMDWRQAVALRNGEFFDMKKFWREGAGMMTTKRKRKYVFVTQGNVYRVCVLADYKSLIISCSIDNAMTICVRNLYVTNKIFENEQGVRYNGTIVACPTTKSLSPGETEATGVFTKICVNRRRTEFKIRCPPEGAHWTAQTRCVDNYRRAPWRGPFDYMFGEAWVGTTVTCPEMSTTEQRYFYITMTCPTTSYPILDVEGLLALVANLTYDYEEDLVAKLNKSLYIFLSPPTTASTMPPQTAPTTTLPHYHDDEPDEGAEVARCYHCGMNETQIPYSAACNDAFANEIMELMPVDPSARAELSNFRKYCRYNKVRDWYLNASDIRSVYGKWTGGCSVRWVDISVVYTERTCRSKDRPAMGHSFASRRHAKLELALKAVDNGCITSPMAVLLPLSRAISLYARFHACVCMGHFCNMAASARAQWAAVLLTLTAGLRA